MEMIIGNIIALLFCVMGFIGNVFSLDIKEHNQGNIIWIIVLMVFISLLPIL